MFHENLISTLDKFKTAVYLKDIKGHYLSMNRGGIDIMKGNHGRVLGKNTYELFDAQTAGQMIETDQAVMNSGRVLSNSMVATDKITGDLISLFNAKTAVLAPSGQPLGVVGISIVNSGDAELFAEVCRLLPIFVQRKQPDILNELLELRTVREFMKRYQLH